MSIMFSARKQSTATRPAKESKEIAERDMSKKRKVIRKVKQLNNDGKVEVTGFWNLLLPTGLHRISFSRDNLHVWVDGKPVNSESYISDKGYDLDLFFTIGPCKAHIYSDVEEGTKMINYILIDGEIMGTDYQQDAKTK